MNAETKISKARLTQLARDIIGLRTGQSTKFAQNTDEALLLGSLFLNGRVKLYEGLVLITKKCNDGKVYIYKEVRS